MLALLLRPYMPATSDRLLDALGEQRASWPRPDRGVGDSGSSGSRAAVSEARELSVVDTHAHLGMCEPGGGELVAAAREAGVRRILTVGIDELEPRCDRSRRTVQGGVRVRGPAPELGRQVRRCRGGRLEELATHERVRAIGETGLDYYRAASDPARRSRRRSRSRAASSCPLVIHMRDSLDDTFDVLASEADGVTVILHCFSAPPERVADAVGNGWHCSFAGNLTYPRSEQLREAARLVPDELLLVETDSPFLAPQPVRGSRTSPQTSRRRRGGWPEIRDVSYQRLEETVEANARACVRLVRRRLGQHFVADPNLLDAIVRESGVGADDVVLEVGGGAGALTERVAARVRQLHVIEVDERLRPELEPIAREAGNVEIVWSDALRVDLSALDPAPTTVVSNLPYSIATPLILKTIDELDSVASWTLLVQREIAERLRASRGVACTARRACSFGSRPMSRSCAPSTAPCSRRGPASTPR